MNNLYSVLIATILSITSSVCLADSESKNAIEINPQKGTEPFAERQAWVSTGIHKDFNPQDTSNLKDAASVTNWLNNTVASEIGLSHSDKLMANYHRSVEGFQIFAVEQQYSGIPLIGYQSRISIDNGKAKTLLGRHHGFNSVDAEQPLLSLEQIQRTLQTVNLHDYPEQSRLVYWPGYNNKLRLAYEISGVFITENGQSEEQVIVSAVTGEVFNRRSLIHDALKRHVADFGAACRDHKVRSVMPTPLSLLVQGLAKTVYSRTEGQTSSGDAIADGVYDLLGHSYQFLNDLFEMDSLDDRGMTLSAFTNVRFAQGSYDPQCVGEAFNASWHRLWNALYLTRDANRFVEVVAHELGHGLISKGSNLVYKKEPGALNEAIADAIGVGFRGWYELGQGSRQIGKVPKDYWVLRSPKGILRHLKYPKQAGEYPDHYDEFVYTSADNGGVHINSSIMNVGFYLLSEGGQHPRLAAGPTVRGIGLIKATQIVGLSASAILTSHSNFEDARYGYAHTAELLFGRNSPEWVAVHQSMDAIGIPGDWQMPTNLEPEELEPEIETPPNPENKQQPNEKQPKTNDDSTPEADDSTNKNAEPDQSLPTVSTQQLMALLLILVALVLLLLFFIYWRGKNKQSNLNSYGADSHWAPAPNTEELEPAQKRSSPLENTNPIVAKEKHRWALTSSSSNKNNKSLELPTQWLTSREGLVIGRAIDLVHIELKENSVSRRHCRLRVKGGQLNIEDLNSSQGTEVNQVRLIAFHPVELKDGDDLFIGEVRCRLVRF